MASTHFDPEGNARMVDVSAKPSSKRLATARACVRMNPEAAALVRAGHSKKGDVLAVARLAAIGATKWTPHLIPLCHAIALESVEVRFDWEPYESAEQLVCTVTCATSAKTGVEMESLTGASLAALTVYDMLKSVDRAMEIGPTYLMRKSGGQSGSFRRSESGDGDPDRAET